MAAAQPWPPPGSPQFAGVRDAWRDATLAEWFLHHPQGKALFRIWAAMQDFVQRPQLLSCAPNAGFRLAGGVLSITNDKTQTLTTIHATKCTTR